MHDIHNHILAGIDDGCEDYETSIQMGKTAQNDGIRTIIATPHYIYGYAENPSVQKIRDMVEELNDALQKQNAAVNVLAGMEVFISPEIPELYKNGEILTLNDSRYMLVELPLNSIPVYFDDIMFRLRVCGVVPVIAHPERNCFFRRNPEKMVEAASEGILFQINSGSLKGFFGEEIRRFAFELLTLGLVHVIASDAHSNHVRRPVLKEAYEIIRRRNKNKLETIRENSHKIVCNKEIANEHIHMKDKKKTNFDLKCLFNSVLRK